MQKLLEALKNSTRPVYVYLANDRVTKRFLSETEKHGFIFLDGEKPTKKDISSFFAVHSDFTMNYIGAVGRIAYQCNAESIIRYDYERKVLL